jgi:hypothetical protein
VPGWPGGRCLCWTRTRHRAHGRVEIRTLKAVTMLGLGLPHAS